MTGSVTIFLGAKVVLGAGAEVDFSTVAGAVVTTTGLKLYLCGIWTGCTG